MTDAKPFFNPGDTRNDFLSNRGAVSKVRCLPKANIAVLTIREFVCGLDGPWSSLINGQSGISKISSIDVSDLPSQIAGQVPRKMGLAIGVWFKRTE